MSAESTRDLLVALQWLDVAAEMLSFPRFSPGGAADYAGSMTNAPSDVVVESSVDLNGLVAQLRARRAELSAEIASLTGERVSVNERIRAKRQELAGVDRLWRATQPRKGSG